MKTIKIGGKEYPAYMTMGASLRYIKAMGKEPSEIHTIEETVTMLHCTVASACNAEGVPFDLPLQDFADRLSPADMTTFYTGVTMEDSEEQKKRE